MLYLNLFLAFVKIGVLGFGGGLAIVQLIYDSIQPFMTISQEQFANIVAISQITPGPLGINVATYVGHECAGVPGALVATLGVAFPAFVIISIVCRMLKQFQDSVIVKGALTGIRPAVIGLIGAAMVTLAPPAVAGETRLGLGAFNALGQSATGVASWLANSPIDLVACAMVAATVVLIAKFKKSPIIVLLIMGCIGAILRV